MGVSGSRRLQGSISSDFQQDEVKAREGSRPAQVHRWSYWTAWEGWEWVTFLSPRQKIPFCFLHKWFVCSLPLLIKWAFSFFHSYTQVIPKFILMARSALVSDVKGCKSIVVSVPWTLHGVKCSQLPAQSRDGWGLGSFCFIAQAHEIKMSTFLNQRTNELKK